MERRDVQTPISVIQVASLAIAAVVARLFLIIIGLVQDGVKALGTVKVSHLGSDREKKRIEGEGECAVRDGA